ncbi:MAG TPA: alpha/beta hydrolase [Candidatus Binatia bacterium]
MLRQWYCGLLLLMMTAPSAAQPIRRSFKTTDNVTLSFLETGAEHRTTPTIVLVPGWLMPARIWQGQINDFSRSYHTLALDPRGQGESQVSSSGYTAERRATDLHEFLLQRSDVLLIGWSLAGIEALQYVYMLGTARLAGLVLVDSSVGEEPAGGSSGRFKDDFRRDRDKTLRQFVRAIFARPRPEKEIADLVRGAKRMPVEASLALLEYPFERTHWRNIVRSFEKPLLYVVTPQYPEQAANLKKNRPATEVEVFKNAGHALFVDEPQRFNALIKKFAARLS